MSTEFTWGEEELVRISEGHIPDGVPPEKMVDLLAREILTIREKARTRVEALEEALRELHDAWEDGKCTVLRKRNAMAAARRALERAVPTNGPALSREEWSLLLRCLERTGATWSAPDGSPIGNLRAKLYILAGEDA